MKTKKDAFYKGLFTCLKWLGLLLAAHVVAWLLFSMLLSGAAEQIAYYEPERLGNVYLMTLMFDLSFIPLFFTLLHKVSPLANTERNAVRQAQKEPGFTLLAYWKTHRLHPTLYALGAYALLQLPFLPFFFHFGFSFLSADSILLDRFYLLDAGFYLVTGSAFLGWLLSLFYFALIMFLFDFFRLRRAITD
ncbi:MAG: hypothetical protein IJX28_07165 [Clostridia bacterium]|nr:hypothetical protein [Clostridia bacterium]